MPFRDWNFRSVDKKSVIFEKQRNGTRQQGSLNHLFVLLLTAEYNEKNKNDSFNSEQHLSIIISQISFFINSEHNGDGITFPAISFGRSLMNLYLPNYARAWITIKSIEIIRISNFFVLTIIN